MSTQVHAFEILSPERPSHSAYLSPTERQAAERREWQRILKEDPLVGPVWDGESQSDDLSDLDDDDLSDGSETGTAPGSPETSVSTGAKTAVSRNSASYTRARSDDWHLQTDHLARILDDLSARQYWRVQRDRVDGTTALDEVNAVREVLGALSGCPSCLFQMRADGSGDVAVTVSSRIIGQFSSNWQA